MLSLTLRDAQHLSWKTFKKFEALNEKRSETLISGDELVKKAREIVDRVEALGLSIESVKKEELGKLFSELVFATLVLAEHSKVDLEESFLQTVDEIILGFVS